MLTDTWIMTTATAIQCREAGHNIPNGQVEFSNSGSENISKIHLGLAEEDFYIFIYSHVDNEKAVKNLEKSALSHQLPFMEDNFYIRTEATKRWDDDRVEAVYFSHCLNDNNGEYFKKLMGVIKELEPNFPDKYLQYILDLTNAYALPESQGKKQTIAAVASRFIKEHPHSEASLKQDYENEITGEYSNMFKM